MEDPIKLKHIFRVMPAVIMWNLLKKIEPYQAWMDGCPPLKSWYNKWK